MPSQDQWSHRTAETQNHNSGTITRAVTPQNNHKNRGTIKTTAKTQNLHKSNRDRAIAREEIYGSISVAGLALGVESAPPDTADTSNRG